MIDPMKIAQLAKEYAARQQVLVHLGKDWQVSIVQWGNGEIEAAVVTPEGDVVNCERHISGKKLADFIQRAVEHIERLSDE